MTEGPDHLLLCYSQPSLSARDEARFSAALHRAAHRVHAQPVSVVRLEGPEQGLAAALRVARDGVCACSRLAFPWLQISARGCPAPSRISP